MLPQARFSNEPGSVNRWYKNDQQCDCENDLQMTKMVYIAYNK